MGRNAIIVLFLSDGSGGYFTSQKCYAGDAETSSLKARTDTNELLGVTKLQLV